MKFANIFFILMVSLVSCKQEDKPVFDFESERIKINQNIDTWHQAAANADFDAYFGLMTNDAVFIGTDATENWNNANFKIFCKPYFDAGKAWSFTNLERHIYFSEDNKTAWFDELLQTQMGVCRGSGVLEIEDDSWKIAHYVLSLTIPNDMVKDVVRQKKDVDSLLVVKLKK